jgi:aspartate kinase
VARRACPLSRTSPPQYSVVMKFGGSSVRDAARMKEVAAIICSFPKELPCVVLSAMGKTTNNLLAAGEAALTCRSNEIGELAPLQAIRELHLRTCEELALPAADVAEVTALLQQLTQLLTGVSLMQELTARTSANLVSFGERLSTRVFAAFLRTQGVAARQYDAFGRLGLVSTDDFGNGDILPASYDVAGAVLRDAPGAPSAPEVAIVTGFLARGEKSGAITTLGRGGSDLTATVLGRALGVNEVQVWKDVDGVLTSDPRIVDTARPVPSLTFEEATELAFFGATVLHPLAMQPAQENGRMGVRVKNSYNK